MTSDIAGKRGSEVPGITSDITKQNAVAARHGRAPTVLHTLAASARRTGTDLDELHISKGGVPSGLVSLPLRYMHSPVEMMQLDDIENAAKLIAAFALSLPADQQFLR